MAFYRSARVRMTRAVTRAMARSGNKNTNAETIERMIQNSKNRFGGTIGRTVATSLSAAIDSNVDIRVAEFLFFGNDEDDDGTQNKKKHTKMVTATATSTPSAAAAVAAETTTHTPRVSENFPRVPAGCEKAAETFFACFYQHGKQPKDTAAAAATRDVDIGNRALRTCAASVDAYNKCVDAAVEKAPKKLFRVPEAYRVRDE